MGVLGLMEHWAVKVGGTWYEVAGPDIDEGHINKGNKEGYLIKESDGPRSASGAKPDSVSMSLTSYIWPIALVLLIGPATVDLAVGGSPKVVLWECALSVALLFILPNWLSYPFICPAVKMWLGWWECVLLQIGLGLGEQWKKQCVVVVAISLLLWKAVQWAWMMTKEPWTDMSAEEAVVVMCWLLTTCLLVNNRKVWKAVWRGQNRDPAFLGTTTRTKEEIREFNTKFKTNHAKYQFLSDNCQLYVQELVEYLMKKGNQTRPLPNPESPGSLLFSSVHTAAGMIWPF